MRESWFWEIVYIRVLISHCSTISVRESLITTLCYFLVLRFIQFILLKSFLFIEKSTGRAQKVSPFKFFVLWVFHASPFQIVQKWTKTLLRGLIKLVACLLLQCTEDIVKYESKEKFKIFEKYCFFVFLNLNQKKDRKEQKTEAKKPKTVSEAMADNRNELISLLDRPIPMDSKV